MDRGHYVTYTKLHRDLYSLEQEIEFAHRHEALSYLEYRKLENEMIKILQRYCSTRSDS